MCGTPSRGFLIGLVGLAASFTAWATPVDAAPVPAVDVIVSILPQKYLVERVGGDRVRVRVMVQPGQSPATFEPSARQMAALARADFYYRVGVPFEAVWMPQLAAANPRMRIADARDGIALRALDGFNTEQRAGGSAPLPDPHIWTSPALVRIMSEKLRDELIALDPASRADYEQNARRFMADLDTLDGEIRERLEGLEQRRFLVFHPSWGYFADTYGLEQVAVEQAGHEPGARSLARLIEVARQEDIRVIFVQSQFSRRDAETIARAIDGRVIAVDPLAEDYLANLRTVAAAFAESLQ